MHYTQIHQRVYRTCGHFEGTSHAQGRTGKKTMPITVDLRTTSGGASLQMVVEKGILHRLGLRRGTAVGRRNRGRCCEWPGLYGGEATGRLWGGRIAYLTSL